MFTLARALLLAAALSGTALPAVADWICSGIAFSCTPSALAFELAIVLESSDLEMDEPPKPGFTKLADGKHALRCRVGNKAVRASIKVNASDVLIEHLTIGSFALFDRPTWFNEGILGEQRLHSIRIHASQFLLKPATAGQRMESAS
jgi:hypothetical protein